MYTPVHDFKRLLNDDHKIYLKHLKEQYPHKIDDRTKISLKRIHKILWLLHIMKESLEEVNIYFEDIFTNVLSLINPTIIKDKKILIFLFRNTIESYIKFSKVFYSDIDTEDNPREIFEKIFSSCQNDSFIHSRYQLIKSNYSDFCGIVHGRNIENFKMSKCLKEYENAFTSSQISDEIEKFNKIILNFVVLYFYIFPQRFNNLVGDSQFIIREAISSQDLAKILEKLR